MNYKNIIVIFLLISSIFLIACTRNDNVLTGDFSFNIFKNGYMIHNSKSSSMRPHFFGGLFERASDLQQEDSYAPSRH